MAGASWEDFRFPDVSYARSPSPRCLFFDLPLSDRFLITGIGCQRHTHTLSVNLRRWCHAQQHTVMTDIYIYTYLCRSVCCVFQVTSRSVQNRRCVPSVPVMGWRELTLDLLLLLLLLLVSHLEAVSFPEDNIPLDVVDRHCKTLALLKYSHVDIGQDSQ